MKISSVFVAVLGLFASANAFTADFNHYWTFDETIAYISHLNHNFHHVAHSMNYGTTLQGRPLESLHLEMGHHQHHRPVIFIVAGIRPREWISTMTALYFIHELVENHMMYRTILESVEFVVVPVANPDGYDFTHTTDRMWNKNRRVNAANPACLGVDLNANFFYQWARTDDPCSPNFSGETFYSESETGELYEFMRAGGQGKFTGRVRTFVSLEAFGEQILTPFSHAAIGGGNQPTLVNLANRIADAIRARNPLRNYHIGIAGLLRAPESGTAIDNALMETRAEFVYAIRLPAGGPTGFDPPTTAIRGIANETLPGLLELGLFFM